jgi:hypothetical protein
VFFGCFDTKFIPESGRVRIQKWILVRSGHAKESCAANQRPAFTDSLYISVGIANVESRLGETNQTSACLHGELVWRVRFRVYNPKNWACYRGGVGF